MLSIANSNSESERWTDSRAGADSRPSSGYMRGGSEGPEVESYR